MAEILEFIFDVLFNLIGIFFFGTPAWDFDVRDTYAMRIFLGVIIAGLAIFVWRELR
jgi:hypothetical protein